MKKIKRSEAVKEIGRRGSLKDILNNERGDIGVKEIAITVAVIVILGFVIAAFKDKMPTFVQDIWNMFKEKIDAIK